MTSPAPATAPTCACASVHTQVSAVVEAALARLRRAGAHLIEVDFGAHATPDPSAGGGSSFDGGSDSPSSPTRSGAMPLESPTRLGAPAPDSSAPAFRACDNPGQGNAAHPLSLADDVITPLLSHEAPRELAAYLYTHTAAPPPSTATAGGGDAEPAYDDEGNPIRRKPAQAGPIPLDTVLSVSALLRSFAGPDPERALLVGQLDARSATGAAAYRTALVERRAELQRAFADYFARHRVAAIVYPTTPLAAVQVRGGSGTPGAQALVLHNGDLVDAEATYSRNTRAASAAGLPSLSVPAGVTKPRAGALKKTTAAERLPVGLEFVAPAGADEHLLALGAAFQRLQSFMPDPVVMARWGEGLTHFTQAP